VFISAPNTDSFARLLTQRWLEQAGELPRLSAGFSDWRKSGGMKREEQNLCLNWTPPVIADVVPDEWRSE
jgi:hypothetical protein